MQPSSPVKRKTLSKRKLIKWLFSALRGEAYLVDFILGIGPGCRVAEHLGRNKLRMLSTPLDWMTKYPFHPSVVHDLYASGFADFFQNRTVIATGEKYYHVKDEVTGLIAMHHFPLDTDIDRFYQSSFLPKMQQRFEVTDQFLKTAGHILLLGFHKHGIDELTGFLNDFHQLYPTKITLLNIVSDPLLPRSSEQKEVYPISKQTKIIQYRINDTHEKGNNPETNPDYWWGNHQKWDDILTRILYTPQAQRRFRALYAQKNRL